MRITFFSILTLFSFFFTSCENEKTTSQKTITDIDSLFVAYPDSVPVLIAHGNMLLKKYNYNKALEDGAKAYRLEPKNLEARMLYAMALNNRASRTTTDVETAQGHFAYIIRKEPKNLAALVALATTYAQQGDNENAFKFINDALRIDVKYRDAYVLKGSIYLSLGNVALAKSSYQTAIDQDPEFYEAYTRLGLIYQDEKDKLCIEYFITAAELKPNSIETLYHLAYAYQEFDEDEKALEVYRKMEKKDKSFTPSLFQQGWIKQFHQNQPDSAIIFYNECLQREPRYVEAWHNLGLIYETKGEKYEAIKYYKRAVKYDKKFQLSIDAVKRLSK